MRSAASKGNPAHNSDRSLKTKAVAGVRWSAASQFGRQGMGIVSTAILARLLSPTDYGLMGMAMVVTGFIGIFRDFGSSPALVQRQELDATLLSTVFWANIAFSLVTGCTIIAISPLAARFFHEPRVALLLCAVAPTFFFNSLSIVQQALLQRGLEFKSLANIELVASLLSYVVAVLVAWLDGGVWSLVAQAYAFLICLAVLLWQGAAWRPTLTFSWPALHSVRRYSVNMVGYSVFNYWARNAGNILIGRFLGSGALGFYSMAGRLVQYPTMATSGLVGRVLFPLLSKMQDDRERLGRAYFRTVSLIAVVTFPLLLGIFAVASPLVHGLLSAKWTPMIAPLMVLALVGANQSLATMTGSIYQSTGHTGLMFRVGIVNGLLYVLGIALGLRGGILGVAIGYAVADALATVIDYFFAFRLIGQPMNAVFSAAWRSLFCSVVMVVPLMLASAWLAAFAGPLAALAILMGMGVFVYSAISWVVNRTCLLDLWRTVRRQT